MQDFSSTLVEGYAVFGLEGELQLQIAGVGCQKSTAFSVDVARLTLSFLATN